MLVIEARARVASQARLPPAEWFCYLGIAGAVTGTRFLVTLVAAIGFEIKIGRSLPESRPMASATLAFTALALIVVPAFAILLGIARTSPFAVNVARALGPVSVFAFQQPSGRLQFSGPTLVCVTAIGAIAFRA